MPNPNDIRDNERHGFRFEFPLVRRELTRIGRSQRAYAWRTFLMIIIVGTLLWQWIVEGRTAFALAARPERLGELLAGTGTFFQYCVVFGFIPLLTAPLIASERRDGTLSLLLLADFRGFDVYASKFVCAYGEACYLILASLPVFAFASFFGGVSVAEELVMQGALMLALGAAVCSIGLFCSLMSRHGGNALFLTVIALLVWQGVAIAIDFYVAFRFDEFLCVSAVAIPQGLAQGPEYGWTPMFSTLFALTFVFSAATVALIPHRMFWSKRIRILGPERPYGTSNRRLMLRSPAAPILAAHASGFASTLHSPGARWLTALLLTIIAFVPGVGGLVLLILICYDITLSMTMAWRNNAIDDLLLTRLGGRILARDIFSFHFARSLIYLPGLAVAVGMLFFVVLFATPVGALEGRSLYAAINQTNYEIMTLVSFVVVFSFIAAAMGQPFTVVSVCCLVSALGVMPRRQTAIAIAILVSIYCVALGLSFWGHITLLQIAFFVENPWIVASIFSVCIGILFVVPGIVAHRWFLKTLGATGGSERFSADPVGRMSRRTA